MAQAFVSNRVLTPEGMRAAAVVVRDGVIAEVCARGAVPEDVEVVDFGDAAIVPGLVDTHVHLNEPGRTEWEGFWTGTRAAAAGGYTTLVDMPLNCLPETTTVAALEVKREAARGKCWVDWTTWGGAVADNQAHLPALAAAGVPGFKCFLIYPGCDGFTMIDTAQLEAALPAIAASGLPLLVHAELAGPIDAATAELRDADWRRYGTYLASRPDEAEVAAIRLMIRLCRAYRFRLHIVHLSSARAVDDLRAAKAEGLPVTVETCPHYLYFAAEDISIGNTLLKCAPPIRSAANRDALWAALREGLIDMLVTDHSPCPPEMKGLDAGRFDEAWGGIASLPVALPAMWTAAVRRGFGLEDVARWMSTAPAALAGMSGRAGSLAIGREASFVVFDPEAEFVVAAEGLHTRHPVSPYVRERLRGVVRATYLRGEAVFEAGRFPAAPVGRDLVGDPRNSDHLLANETAGPSTLFGVRPPNSAQDDRCRLDGVNAVLARWNGLDTEAAAREVLPCCGSQAWAAELAAQRPFGDVDALYAASDRVWWEQPEGVWREAFDSHPRIGQSHAQKAATPESLRWSAQEQQAAVTPDEVAKQALAATNLRYEEKFGRIFIVCASGRSAAEILAMLEARMGNDQDTELREAAEQQRQITQLRLRRWMEA